MRTRRQSDIGVRALLTGTAIGLVTTANAQVQQEPPADADEAVVLGTVSVEAEEASEYRVDRSASTRFTAPLVDTPRSVTVITESLVEDTASTSLTDALRTVPGITMAMGEGGQPFADRPFIRGYESTTGILVDGTRDSASQSRDTYNLEQIEVAKGSNGAFAGRGAPGGSINLVTKRARGEDGFSGSVQLGNADQKRATWDLNKTLAPQVAFRLNGMIQRSDVPGREAVYEDRTGIAPSLTLGLTTPTRLQLAYEHYEGEGLMDYGHPLSLQTNEPVEGLGQSTYYGLADRDFHDTELDAVLAELTHEVNDTVTLRNITRYSDSSNAYIASNPDDSRGNVENGLVERVVKSANTQNETLVNQTELLAGFDAGGTEHTITAGFEYLTEDVVRATYDVDTTAPGGVPIPRGGCDEFGAGAPSDYNCTTLYDPNPYDPWRGSISLGDPTETEADTWSVYAFDSIAFGERFVATLGLRYEDFSTETSSGLSNESEFLTYQAGLTFKPTETSSLYASYGTSASPAGVTVGDGAENIADSNENLDPQHGSNLEVGYKHELFDQNLLLTAAAFRTEIEDAYVSVEPGRGGRQEAIGEQRVQGIELSAQGRITEGWEVIAGYSYLDAEVIDAGPLGEDQEGNRLPNTPEHSLTLWTQANPIENVLIGGGAFYVGERFGSTRNDRRVDGYWRLDAVAAYEVRDGVSLQLNVNNLTDELYYDRVYAAHMATVGPGRSVLGTIRVTTR